MIVLAIKKAEHEDSFVLHLSDVEAAMLVASITSQFPSGMMDVLVEIVNKYEPKVLAESEIHALKLTGKGKEQNSPFKQFQIALALRVMAAKKSLDPEARFESFDPDHPEGPPGAPGEEPQKH